jgi:hypothetical protein
MRVSSDMKFGGATVHFAITAPAIGAIAIAVIAIGSQSIRAAMVNPAESLRSE